MVELYDSAYRLCQAIDMIAGHWSSFHRIERDLDPEIEAIHAWFWVPNLYQLIEQSFKLLLKSENQEIQKIHRLSELYCRLDSNHRLTLDNIYRGYRDLYDYLPDKGLESFLKRLDGSTDEQTGYTSWRYMPLEGLFSEEHETPSIHIGAMLEVSISSRDIMQREIVYKNSEAEEMRPIILRIKDDILDEINSIVQDYCSQNEVRLRIESQEVRLEDVRMERLVYCRNLLFRNLVWVYGYMTSSPCLKLSPENTAFLEAICKRMMKDHRHDFMQYIHRLESGDMEPFDVSVS